MNATITLREYLEKGKCFVVPNYQRGYVWGKNKPGAKDAVTYMMESLRNGFKSEKDVFIQGVTVSESENKIILIDGQQRTTFFYLLLKHLRYSKKFCINYEIRQESNEFLSQLTENILNTCEEDGKEEFQDIHFFKKTLRLIRNIGEDREKFLNYVLEHVKFLYIDIPQDKATTVFSMMNGNKAEMKAEELIKAELLRLASLNETSGQSIGEKELYSNEWDKNMLRSRYAREWDKWLQWWNREDVRHFYKVDNVMGLLVSTYLGIPGSNVSFEEFRETNLSGQKPIDAKKAFDKLRRLQKHFEDTFNSPKAYNMVGAILRTATNREEFVKWYFKELQTQEKEEKLERYYKLAFLELTHKEILDDNKEKFEEKFDQCYKDLDDNNLYHVNPEAAFRLLLRLNIDEDNKQRNGVGRKFDFSIWDNKNRGRSLEHIYPKSRVCHTDGEGNKKDGNNKEWEEKIPFINREDCCCKIGEKEEKEFKASEHSIGNLVLLYKDDNSSFNDSSFEEKKAMFFLIPNNDKEEKSIFKSRHLLHTIYKFAKSTWTSEDIAKNKFSTLKDFEKYYGKE